LFARDGKGRDHLYLQNGGVEGAKDMFCRVTNIIEFGGKGII